MKILLPSPLVLLCFSWWLPFMGNMSVDTIPDATLWNKTKLVEHLFYIGNIPNNSTVSDMRVSYKKLNSMTVSIVVQQMSNTFKAYIAKAEKPLLLWTKVSTHPTKCTRMLMTNATALTWIFWCIGMFIVYLGLILIMAPLIMLVDIILFIGDMIEGMMYCIMIPVAFVILLMVVSFTCLAYHLALIVPLVLVCFGSAYYSCYWK